MNESIKTQSSDYVLIAEVKDSIYSCRVFLTKEIHTEQEKSFLATVRRVLSTEDVKTPTWAF